MEKIIRVLFVFCFGLVGLVCAMHKDSDLGIKLLESSLVEKKRVKEAPSSFKDEPGETVGNTENERLFGGDDKQKKSSYCVDNEDFCVTVTSLPVEEMQDFFIGCDGFSSFADAVGTRVVVCLIAIEVRSSQSVEFSGPLYAKLKKACNLSTYSLSSSGNEIGLCSLGLAQGVCYFFGLLLLEGWDGWEWDDSYWSIYEAIETCCSAIGLPFALKKYKKSKRIEQLVMNKLMRTLDCGKPQKAVQLGPWVNQLLGKAGEEKITLMPADVIYDVLILPLKQFEKNCDDASGKGLV